jgi:hypothetical protein
LDPDENTLYSVGDDQLLKKWNLETGIAAFTVKGLTLKLSFFEAILTQYGKLFSDKDLSSQQVLTLPQSNGTNHLAI